MYPRPDQTRSVFSPVELSRASRYSPVAPDAPVPATRSHRSSHQSYTQSSTVYDNKTFKHLRIPTQFPYKALRQVFALQMLNIYSQVAEISAHLPKRQYTLVSSIMSYPFTVGGLQLCRPLHKDSLFPYGVYTGVIQHELSTIPISHRNGREQFFQLDTQPNFFNASSSMPLYLWLLNHQHLVRPTSCPPVNTPYQCWDCILSVMSYLYIMQHTYISTLSHIVYNFNTVGRLFSYSKCF